MTGTFDVAIIGAGVVGASIARRLSAYKIDVILLWDSVLRPRMVRRFGSVGGFLRSSHQQYLFLQVHQRQEL